MRKILFLTSVSLIGATPAWAEDALGGQGSYDPAITVLATGLAQPVDRAGQSVSVMGEEEIDSIQSPDLTRVFERLPGVTFSRNGGLGAFTGVRVRGANAEQLLVLVDGIRVADVASPGGGYDFGTLATGGYGRVELLRGSNSVIWGSQAIGGVMALTTRELNGVEASAEYGSRDSVNAQVTGGIDGESHSVTLTGGYTETDGFSSAASGTEHDGFRQWRVGGRGEVAVSDRLFATFAGRYADSRLEFDGFANTFPYGLVDTPEFTKAEEISARAGVRYEGEALWLDAGYAIYDNSRDNYDPRLGTEPGFASDGRQQRVELKGRYDLAGPLRLDFGADHDWSHFDTNYDDPANADATSGHALLGWYGDRITLAAGARIDDHSRFGSEWTFGANGSLAIAQGWRLRASYGEGFKAPTLYQLFSDFGNEALAPERSRSWDVGIERGDRNDALHLALTAFRRNSRDLIDFASCFSVSSPLCDDGRFGFYTNTAKARAEGFEVELGARPTEHLHAQAAYSFVKATDRTPGGANFGNELARRPRHALTVSVDWETPLAGLMLGGDVRIVSDSFDDAGNFTRLDGYAIGSVRASLPVNEAFELYGRVENVTDSQYQTAAGYATAGRSAFVGARARF